MGVRELRSKVAVLCGQGFSAALKVFRAQAPNPRTSKPQTPDPKLTLSLTSETQNLD